MKIPNTLRSKAVGERFRRRIRDVNECHAASLHDEGVDKRSTDARRTARDKNAASREVRIPRTIVATLGHPILPYETLYHIDVAPSENYRRQNPSEQIMDMPVNSFKRTIASGAVSYGAWL